MNMNIYKYVFCVCVCVCVCVCPHTSIYICMAQVAQLRQMVSDSLTQVQPLYMCPRTTICIYGSILILLYVYIVVWHNTYTYICMRTTIHI